LSTSQLGNGALVHAVMMDFIAQVRRRLELDGQTVSRPTNSLHGDPGSTPGV